MGGCPDDFKHAGYDPTGLWQPYANTGACVDGPGSTTAFPDELRNTIFCFNDKGGVDVDLARTPSGVSTEACMSFGTSTACTFPKHDVKEIQFTISTSGCTGENRRVWTAPLWYTPLSWEKNQQTSGEVDFIESCGLGALFSKTGFAANFGWDQNSWPINADLTDPHVYYIKFENSLTTSDSVEGHMCPANSDPIRDGLSNCEYVGISNNYFLRTYHDESDHGANKFTFVTDIWNSLVTNAGLCNPNESSLENRSCKYRVTDIKMTFKKPWKYANTHPCSLLQHRSAPARPVVPVHPNVPGHPDVIPGHPDVIPGSDIRTVVLDFFKSFYGISTILMFGIFIVFMILRQRATLKT